MPRIIEIALFLTPFLALGAWRLWFPSPLPPAWLIYGLMCFAGLMMVALIWVWALDAGDGNQPYIPERLLDGRVVPGSAP